jgi:hypothetical protein
VTQHSALVVLRHGHRLVGVARGALRGQRVTVRLRANGRLRGGGRTTVTITLGHARATTVLHARIAVSV